MSSRKSLAPRSSRKSPGQERAAQPEWIRLPRSGDTCPHSGLKRSALDKLVRPQECNDFKPPVESRILKMAGDKRGLRLISFRSLCSYIESLPSG